MIRSLALAAALVASTAAHAGPELPAPYHGAWCGDASVLQRCSGSGDFFIHVDATTTIDGKFFCSLRRLELTEVRDEYHASYDCHEAASRFAVVRIHHKRFRLGFYQPADEPLMFMEELR